MNPKERSPKERSAWSNLPNARHIDAILLHVRKHPGKWDAAWEAAWEAAREAAREAAWDAACGAMRAAAREAAWDAAKDTAWDAAWDATRGAAWDAARGAACVAVWDACVALIAWDDAGELMDADMDLMKFLVGVQDPRAVLLMPARIAMQEERSPQERSQEKVR